MSKRISYKVEGTVQGVNFRSWTTDQANKLSVTGYVQNASDGTVIGEAQADGTTLDKFVQQLHTGPPASKVSKVEQKEIPVKEDEKGFKQ